jgi:imidazolonepropionase-like amidohydrolase
MAILLTGITAATMRGGYGLIPDAALLIEGDTIAWIGPQSRAPEAETIDFNGKLLTPGLIDAHTHLIYAGNRAAEFELRLQGASYEEIARAGGGILSTVTATRAASEDDLIAQSLPRLDAMIAQGLITAARSKVIWQSAPLPNDAFAVSAVLAKDVGFVKRLQVALAEIGPLLASQPNLLPANYTGFVAKDNGFYRPIRDAGLATGKLGAR